MKKLLYMLPILMAMGCYTKKTAIQKFCPSVSISVKDSSVIKWVSRDSINIKDSIVITRQTEGRITISVDSTGKAKPGTYTTTEGKNTTTLIITDTGIVCLSYCEGTVSYYKERYQNYKDSFISLQKHTSEKISQAPEKKLSWFKRFQQWSSWFWWVGLLFAFRIIYRIASYFVPLPKLPF